MKIDNTSDQKLDRFASVESHVAHQDIVINDLSDMVADQWKAIDEMKKQIERLKGRLQSVEESMERPLVGEKPPPHY
ncbi:MAG: hypothetical protein CBB68_04800 [Rhodospirillaceae bacterium TMED8]|nr:SlyX protein [Magnetovibrio sp.]OUT51649.1 MAG: hypothetical protein CBB68_04800 [Rhodospirillaceae bacterium TMED8]|tara:strand:- start:446 stop:676 length:231 start_codon:yes stop_codon:yes gene_type:complete